MSLRNVYYYDNKLNFDFLGSVNMRVEKVSQVSNSKDYDTIRRDNDIKKNQQKNNKTSFADVLKAAMKNT